MANINIIMLWFFGVLFAKTAFAMPIYLPNYNQTTHWATLPNQTLAIIERVGQPTEYTFLHDSRIRYQIGGGDNTTEYSNFLTMIALYCRDSQKPIPDDIQEILHNLYNKMELTNYFYEPLLSYLDFSKSTLQTIPLDFIDRELKITLYRFDGKKVFVTEGIGTNLVPGTNGFGMLPYTFNKFEIGSLIFAEQKGSNWTFFGQTTECGNYYDNEICTFALGRKGCMKKSYYPRFIFSQENFFPDLAGKTFRNAKQFAYKFGKILAISFPSYILGAAIENKDLRKSAVIQLAIFAFVFDKDPYAGVFFPPLPPQQAEPEEEDNEEEGDNPRPLLPPARLLPNITTYETGAPAA